MEAPFEFFVLSWYTHLLFFKLTDISRDDIAIIISASGFLPRDQVTPGFFYVGCNL